MKNDGNHVCCAIVLKEFEKVGKDGHYRTKSTMGLYFSKLKLCALLIIYCSFSRITNVKIFVWYVYY